MRKTATSILSALAILGLAGTTSAAEVTLIFDDSRNPTPHEQIFCALNVHPGTGEYDSGWNDFKRFPLFDDGQHGDRQAGDHVWGWKLNIQPNAEQTYEWAADADSESSNGWLGPCPSFRVPDDTPREVLAYSIMPESDLSPQQLSKQYGVDMTTTGPPVRLNDQGKVLFRVWAPSARRVYLAGDFNEFANNESGVITDISCLMESLPNGLWYQAIDIPTGPQRYKFVLEKTDGKFDWIGDPNVREADSDGNSIINLDRLRTPAAEQSNTSSQTNNSWQPYSPLGVAQAIKNSGSVFVYVRLNGNTACRAFERKYLLHEDAKKLLAGKTLFFLSGDDPDFQTELAQMGVYRVPTLAFCDSSGEWKTLNFDETTAPSAVWDFLARK
ncbi:hypothetical protein KQI84_18315 [bacterium]|nr:hypothetical protein [bacterium]